jgi:hypothetical protein
VTAWKPLKPKKSAGYTPRSAPIGSAARMSATGTTIASAR